VNRLRDLGTLLLAAFVLQGCEKARNYPDPAGPRYAGGIPSPDPDPTLKVVTFNIRYAREIDRALEVFQKEPFKGADLIALQEMDAPGTERMAAALGCAYVYYPAAFHPGGGKDFGNAVLSRWPILDDHKVLLPHPSPFRSLQRAATAATVSVRGVPIRVYSVHLEAPAALTPAQRRDQAETVARDALRFPGPVVVAGDFNNHGVVGKIFEQAGFEWVTRALPATISWFTWDHVFVRGLRKSGPQSAGVALANNGASNHVPVWADLLVPGGVAGAGGGP
jgi:endonuclease/exonuclease/phosphatase family metal-dependent hydrolase